MRERLQGFILASLSIAFIGLVGAQITYGPAVDIQEVVSLATGDARWVNIDGDTMTGPLVVNSSMTITGLLDGSTFDGRLIGNADTATALAANPTDCSSNQFANAIAASGNLTCSAISDADVPDTITASSYLPLAGGTMTGPLVVNSSITVTGLLDGSTFDGRLIGNADTATALAANPTDCSSNQFANAIAASGNLTCAALADADIPDTITASSYLPLAGGTMAGNLDMNGNDIILTEIGRAHV